MSRRRYWVKRMKDLREGDVLMNYGSPLLLVKRVSHKSAPFYSHSKPQYWYNGLFLDLTSGATKTVPLRGAMIQTEVIWAPREPTS